MLNKTNKQTKQRKKKKRKTLIKKAVILIGTRVGTKGKNNQREKSIHVSGVREELASQANNTANIKGDQKHTYVWSKNAITASIFIDANNDSQSTIWCTNRPGKRRSRRTCVPSRS